MTASDDEFDLSLDSVFPEPPRPPTPQPTTATFTRDERFLKGDSDWKNITIKLVGDHPLWGHYLWNAARAFATYLDENPDFYRARNVLELGAGGALPSIVTAKNDAALTIVTDYPDASLINNIQDNIDANFEGHSKSKILAEGYIWGQSAVGLLDTAESTTGRRSFDLIILSDLVFNHSQHDALLSTCEAVLTSSSTVEEGPEPCVLVFYSHHRPHLAHRDMEFFSKAKDRGWKVEKVVEERFPVMFPEDSGDETVRSTVHGWRLTKP
ncbi:nicotinamide N-methyltransferase [Coprinopsis marcescibilis]|uniref:Protein N-terminal and lysine N-methyltransferase EFM7 n=1 Tax=Coprinopsis marcescibilis TaxID=230819 RepID=A0A5C3KS77_COPMA|nr:nicotinamide N-methyltransferase [Coprinopsis marcescibilis]